ncbi:MAG TPA: amylo-alpha-1,6-glucosidase, partial [Phycisphaerae bacterium]|nr:amylo-alpha-1,6-glucosidase [Phycisphaerae bacterium]
GIRTRRYHALLLAATTPPTGRQVLVSGLDAWLETPGGTAALSSQRYAPDVIHPDNGGSPDNFALDPWPRWTLRGRDGTRVEQEIFAVHGLPLVAVRWRLVDRPATARLHVRPFLAGRDYHALMHQNDYVRFEPEIDGERLTWRLYDGVTPIVCLSNARYQHEPYWFRSFLYREEQLRGLDCLEDLPSPGVLHFDLLAGDAVWMMAAGGPAAAEAFHPGEGALVAFERLRVREQRRRAGFATPLDRAADAYLVQRATGRTVVAGYPWFTDWGRDTFIAVRGLCIAAGRLDEARDILLEWSRTVSQGMLPNRFPDGTSEPEYNSVDASLWFIIAVQDLLHAAERAGRPLDAAQRARLMDAVEEILVGYSTGTRYGIHADNDGLLAAGEPGQQLTWMDARVDNWVVTPRIGKPVEVQALWLNALHFAAQHNPRWLPLFNRGKAAFQFRFWNESAQCLYDVIDCEHTAGACDASLRPNQVYAVGGLPLVLLAPREARRVVDVVEGRLLTPLGLRSLSPDDPHYVGRYEGGVRQRDGSYHQGTVWPFLMGPFVEAWIRVHADARAAGRPTADIRRQAHDRFLRPLLAHLDDAGLGHVSEGAGAAAPHAPRGCPFQA